MRYEFTCDVCHGQKEFFKPIAEGPPKKVLCGKCTVIERKKVFMRHEFGANFILKGDGWAGKDLKKREYDNDKANADTEAMLQRDKNNKRVVEEVMEVRRQGSEATRRLKKDKPQKVKDYQDAIGQGYRADAKSYRAKSKDIKKVNDS